MTPLKQLPIADRHRAAGARMMDFGGWEMPVQYAGIIAEHEHTRRAASIFDCSHMGEFYVSGPGAGAALDHLLARPAGNQKPGTGRYNFLMADDGGVHDDLIAFRLGQHAWYLVVNAGTAPGDAAYLADALPHDAPLLDRSAETAKFDIQGPEAPAVLAALGLPVAHQPRYFRFDCARLAGIDCLVSTTGYTGERGFELYVPTPRAGELWDRLLAIEPLRPAGLGARDTLRLEMGYPLYGHELSRAITPVEAGFGALLDPARDFVGAAALRDRPPARELVGLRLESRRVARAGATVLDAAGEPLGTVSSGSYCPSLGVAAALAFVRPGSAPAGTAVRVVTERAELAAVASPLPLYENGTVGR